MKKLGVKKCQEAHINLPGRSLELDRPFRGVGQKPP